MHSAVKLYRIRFDLWTVTDYNETKSVRTRRLV